MTFKAANSKVRNFNNAHKVVERTSEVVTNLTDRHTHTQRQRRQVKGASMWFAAQTQILHPFSRSACHTVC